MRREDAPERIFVIDTETSGTDIENDRIITCYAMIQNIKGEVEWEHNWIIDPGVEIPTGASDVHGMTTEWVQENGRKDVKAAIQEIYAKLKEMVEQGVPIVAFNLPFDAGLIDREVRRHGNPHGLDGLAEKAIFFDPFVADKALDKFRKGKRKLVNVAEHYGIEVDESKTHAADYDVYLTGKVTWRILQTKINKPLKDIQKDLIAWKLEQATSLQDYFERSGTTNDDGTKIVIDGSFPYKKVPLW